MKTDLAITDARYYGHTDTSPGPKLKFSLFFSRYNGHFRHVFKHWCHLNSCNWQNNSKLALCYSVCEIELFFLQRGKVRVAHDFSSLGDKISENAVTARSTQSTNDRYFTANPTADWANCSSGSTVCITFELLPILKLSLNARFILFILICR